jgi:hypothetical protein
MYIKESVMSGQFKSLSMNNASVSLLDEFVEVKLNVSDLNNVTSMNSVTQGTIKTFVYGKDEVDNNISAILGSPPDNLNDGWNFTFTSYTAPPQDRGLGTMGR